MTLARTVDLMTDAAAAGRAVAAFNVITLEHAEAIATGAARAGRPAILQVSENAVRFHGGDPRPLLAACRAVAEVSGSPLSLHLDHVQDAELALRAIDWAVDLGVSSIMIDGSALDDDANRVWTADLAAQAQQQGLWVEAELGEIGGKDGAHAPGARTDPADAAMFVAATGVDGLAVAVGSSHAMQVRDARLDVELVARLAAALTVPLVLHGSSGVPDEVIARAVAAGIRKVNIGTALNVAGTTALRAALAAAPGTVDPRPSLREARDAIADTVEAFLRVVG